MIGVEITNKETGIPLFRYEFRPNVLNNSDIRGGLITAIMQVMGETFGETETKIVNYGQYHAILAEGKYVYGVLFTFQTGAIFEQFILELIKKFEKKFALKLEDEIKNNPITAPDYDFSRECNESYNNLLQVDISKLSQILEFIHSSGEDIFENMLIFLRPGMSQIYSQLDNKAFYGYVEEVTSSLQSLLELSFRTPFKIEDFRIRLSRMFYCLMVNVSSYSIIVFIRDDQLEKARVKFKEIKRSMEEP